jgi:hypothetical protein
MGEFYTKAAAVSAILSSAPHAQASGQAADSRPRPVDLIPTLEGRPKDIESFLAAIRNEMDRNITKTEETTKPATGKFQGFGIRY